MLGVSWWRSPLKVSTLNVTALGKRLDTVLAFLQAECTQTMLLQETRISPKCIESIRNRASKAGWVLHIGFQPPLSKVMGPKGFFRQPTGGLATLVHKQIPSAAIQFPQNLQYLHQYCLPIWLSVSNGRTGLVLVNCYLPTGSAARATREEILRDIFQFASLYDHCPVIIGGDLQMDTSESSAIALCSPNHSLFLFFLNLKKNAKMQKKMEKPKSKSMCFPCVFLFFLCFFSSLKTLE